MTLLQKASGCYTLDDECMLIRRIVSDPLFGVRTILFIYAYKLRNKGIGE